MRGKSGRSRKRMWKNLALIGCGGTIYVMVELIYR